MHSNPHPSLGPCSSLGLVHCRTKHQLQLCSPHRRESQGAAERESDFSPPHTRPETVVIRSHWGRKEFGAVKPPTQGLGHRSPMPAGDKKLVGQNPAPARASSRLGTLQPPPPPQGCWLRGLESLARTGQTSSRLRLSLAAQHAAGIS